MFECQEYDRTYENLSNDTGYHMRHNPIYYQKPNFILKQFIHFQIHKLLKYVNNLGFYVSNYYKYSDTGHHCLLFRTYSEEDTIIIIYQYLKSSFLKKYVALEFERSLRDNPFI